jgi:hypothetical protein
MASEVILGFAGDLVDAKEVTQWATKAGGWPCVPEAVPSSALLYAAVCPVCRQARTLVMQVRSFCACLRNAC